MTKRKIKIRILALVSCIALILCTAPIFYAADKVDTDKPASLTITFFPEDIAASEVEFRLYRVADIDSYGDLTKTAAFSSIESDLSTPDASLWQSLVPLLEGYISQNSVVPTADSSTDIDGKVSFDGLPVGLYFVCGDSYVINHDVYSPNSFLVMLPGMGEDGAWDYNISALPKFDKTDEKLDITVVKNWNDSNSSKRPSSVEVTLYKNDEVYEKVVLSSDNSWKYTWEQLSARENWSLAETAVDGYKVEMKRENNTYTITNISTAEPPALPQTGMLWWPVPLLAAAGMIFFLLGLIKNRNTDITDEK